MKTLKFHVLTLFPEFIEQSMEYSIAKRAVDEGIVSVDAVNIRDYSKDRHHSVDDYVYGGGAGMLMQAQPVYDAYMSVAEKCEKPPRCVFLTPQGSVFTESMARELAQEDELILLCGHYEGIDERVIEKIVTDNISIGDYVLTGGELPALVVMDAVMRFIPGVLHNEDSAENDSFTDGLLECPQYSRPEVWEGMRVPEILLSGDHKKVDEWRRQQSVLRTYERRKDLLEKADLDDKDKRFIENHIAKENDK